MSRMHHLSQTIRTSCPFNLFGCRNGIRYWGMGRRSIPDYMHINFLADTVLLTLALLSDPSCHQRVECFVLLPDNARPSCGAAHSTTVEVITLGGA
ncbi:hypothetical protein AVEN_197230-1 [Araneus ventricosus]|uniref:Uncharacterized protein n=1 Tax=Araneus ventricosus TaxID=182803 RepID=A0A4Y2IF22_ARAVE|nr:hypothetical protein AVEN_197230-1 [Araneus ventricosus]